MSRSLPSRAFSTLRKMIRRRRAPGPSEQQWLRLILLVRRLQRGQFAVAERLDDIRRLTGALGSFRSDFGALHEQLAAARESAGELERGLSERLKALDSLPDPARDRAAFDQRLGTFDGVVDRLERLAGQAPPAVNTAAELAPVLGRLTDLAARLEAASELSGVSGGQDELARLYERIQDLAEGLASTRSVAGDPQALEGDAGAALAQLGAQLDELQTTVQAFNQSSGSETSHALARLERLFEQGLGAPRDPAAPDELRALLARFESLTTRLENAPVALPELPPGTIGADPTIQRELEELRVALVCEQEGRRQLESELGDVRERLRASELSRVEAETRHTTEMAQVADHVGRQLRRVEDDLKKKKRGLSELTQQNIALQTRLNEVQARLAARDAAEPPPALPRERSEAPRPDRAGTGE